MASDSATPIILPLNTPQAQEAAQYLAIALDLEYARQTCEALRRAIRDTRQSDPRGMDFLHRSFFTAMLVAYMRCFTSGSRRHLDENEVFAGDSDALALHLRYRAVRDEHVANSNPFVEVQTGVTLAGTATGALEIVGVKWGRASHPAAIVKETSAFAKLVSAGLKYAETKATRLQEEVKASVRSMTPEEVLKQGEDRSLN